MSSSDFDAKRLGRYVLARRGNITQAQIQKWGGLSDTMQGAVEGGGMLRTARIGTYEKIDRSLGWAPGSTKRILAGGEPEELPGWPPENAERLGASADTIFGEAANLSRMSIDDLAEHWAHLDIEATRAGREYARRRGLTFKEAKDELYRYLRDGGMPSDDHPEADFSAEFIRRTGGAPDHGEAGERGGDTTANTQAGVSPAKEVLSDELLARRRPDIVLTNADGATIFIEAKHVRLRSAEVLDQARLMLDATQWDQAREIEATGRYDKWDQLLLDVIADAVPATEARAARRGAPGNPRDTTTGEGSQDAGGSDPA